LLLICILYKQGILFDIIIDLNRLIIYFIFFIDCIEAFMMIEGIASIFLVDVFASIFGEILIG